MTSFADYKPDAHGCLVPAETRALRWSDINECARLAAERSGGPVQRWASAFEHALADPERHILVAIVAGDVLGYAVTQRLDPADGGGKAPAGWYLTGVVISAAHRRRGLGRLLTQARLDWLTGRTDRVWYVAAAVNRASLDLHAGLGFTEVTREVSMPGVSFPDGVGVLSVKELPGRGRRGRNSPDRHP